MFRRETLQSAREPMNLREKGGDDISELQHERGVECVLARGAPMDIRAGLGVLLIDERAQPLDDGNGFVAGDRSVVCDSVHIEATRVAL